MQIANALRHKRRTTIVRRRFADNNRSPDAALGVPFLGPALVVGSSPCGCRCSALAPQPTAVYFLLGSSTLQVDFEGAVGRARVYDKEATVGCTARAKVATRYSRLVAVCPGVPGWAFQRRRTMNAHANPLIFISYREADTFASVVEISRKLEAAFQAEIFLDKEKIGLGDSISAKVQEHLEKTTLLLLVIGANWFKPREGERSAPIHMDDDWVRHEIRTALELKVPIVPVYVNTTRLKDKELPPDVRQIATLEPGGAADSGILSAELRPGSYEPDLNNLVDRLAESFDLPRKSEDSEPESGDRLDVDWELRHFERLADELGLLSPALPSHDQQQWPLAEVFVPLEVRSRRVTLRDGTFEWSRLIEGDRCAIVGAPGSGKSTLLAHLALTAASRRRAVLESAPGLVTEATERIARIPVWIDLPAAARRLREERQDRKRPLRDLVNDDWLDVVELVANLDGREEARALLDQGNVLLLFDGLDEVGGTEERSDLLLSIARLPTAYGSLGSRNNVVVACRDRAWGGGRAYAPFEQLAISPMDRPRWELYLSRWCRAVWGDAADAVLENLNRALRSQRAIQEMAANPQTATMLAVLAHEGPLPTQRIELYEALVESALGSDVLQREHGDAEVVRAHLSALAGAIQKGKLNGGGGDDAPGTESTETLALRDAQALLGKRVSGKGARDTLAVRRIGGALLDALELHTGLIAAEGSARKGKAGTGVVRFRHRTIQEFLVAAELVENDHANDILAHATDPAWVVAIALTAGLLAVDGSNEELKEFLSVIAETPDFDSVDDDAIEEWSWRMGTLSACLEELWDRDLPEDVLDPAIEAHKASSEILSQLDQTTRIRIVEGMGALRDPRLEPTMVSRWVEIQGGRSVTGAESDEAWVQERPVRSLDVSDFRIQRWPVTISEYARFLVDAKGYEDDEWWDEEGRRWRDDLAIKSPEGWALARVHGNRPVTGVSWWEARAYARWLGHVEEGLPAGWTVTLPTELQWERAARGPSDRQSSMLARFPWGTDWDPGNAHYAGLNSLRHALPVGLFPDGNSPEHVWDLAGNVSERCLDGFGPPSEQALMDHCFTDYTFGHVVRGGGFDSPPLNLRLTARFPDEMNLAANQRSDAVGFRCTAWQAPEHLG